MFTFILGLGLFFLTRFTHRAPARAPAIAAARTLFGSIFGLGAGEAVLAAGVSLLVVIGALAIARPLLFSLRLAGGGRCPRRAHAGCSRSASWRSSGWPWPRPARRWARCWLLGLLAAPAAAAHRLARGPAAGMALAAALALAAMWGGLALAYAIPSLPPSSAVIGVAAAVFYVSRIFT